MNLTSEIHWKNTLNIIRDEAKLNATKLDLQIGREKFAKYILIFFNQFLLPLCRQQSLPQTKEIQDRVCS